MHYRYYTAETGTARDPKVSRRDVCDALTSTFGVYTVLYYIRTIWAHTHTHSHHYHLGTYKYGILLYVVQVGGVRYCAVAMECPRTPRIRIVRQNETHLYLLYIIPEIVLYYDFQHCK